MTPETVVEAIVEPWDLQRECRSDRWPETAGAESEPRRSAPRCLAGRERHPFTRLTPTASVTSPRWLPRGMDYIYRQHEGMDGIRSAKTPAPLR